MLWFHVHETSYVPSKKIVCFTVLWSSCIHGPLASKAKCFGGSSSWSQTLRLKILNWGSKLSLLLENLNDIIIFRFVGRPLGGYGSWWCDKNVHPVILSPLLCLEYRTSFFGKFQSFLSMVVKQLSCDFGVFVRQGVLKSFYFTVFSRTKWLLSVWTLSLSSVCSGCLPPWYGLCRRSSPGSVSGQAWAALGICLQVSWVRLLSTHSQDRMGSAWRLLVSPVVAACAHLWTL